MATNVDLTRRASDLQVSLDESHSQQLQHHIGHRHTIKLSNTRNTWISRIQGVFVKFLQAFPATSNRTVSSHEERKQNGEMKLDDNNVLEQNR